MKSRNFQFEPNYLLLNPIFFCFNKIQHEHPVLGQLDKKMYEFNFWGVVSLDSFLAELGKIIARVTSTILKNYTLSHKKSNHSFIFIAFLYQVFFQMTRQRTCDIKLSRVSAGTIVVIGELYRPAVT